MRRRSNRELGEYVNPDQTDPREDVLIAHCIGDELHLIDPIETDGGIDDLLFAGIDRRGESRAIRTINLPQQ